MPTLRAKSPSLVAVPRLDHHVVLRSFVDSIAQNKAENTRARYRSVLGELLHYLGVADVNATDPRPILISVAYTQADNYLSWCRNRPARPGRSANVDRLCSMGTVRHKAIVLTSLWDKMMLRGLVQTNPWRLLAQQFDRAVVGKRSKHKAIPFAEVSRVVDLPDPATKEGVRDRAIMRLLFGGGLRRSEASALTLEDVCSLHDGTVYLRLRNTKASELKEHALSDWCSQSLTALVAMRKAEGALSNSPLFVAYYGPDLTVPDTRPLSTSTIYRTFKRYCARAGLSEDYTPHCARVTFVNKLLSDGMTHAQVKEASRHASVASVEVYERRMTELSSSPAKKITFDK